MKKIIVLASLALALVSCSNEPEARRVLEMNGYTNISITGYQFNGCSDSDYFTTGFVANNANGATVRGVVCSSFGPFAKGSTIRF